MNEYRSLEINLISGALSKAQGMYKKLIPNEEGPNGKYANLEALLDSVRDALSSNGLAFHQYLELKDEGSGAGILRTSLSHDSGQWFSSCARVFNYKTDRQTGNAYEFIKRTHAHMILGVAPSKNDPLLFDDNGQTQAENVLIEELKRPKQKQQEVTTKCISNSEYDDLMIELDGYENILQNLLETYGLDSLANLPKEKLRSVREQVFRIKKTEEEYLRRKS